MSGYYGNTMPLLLTSSCSFFASASSFGSLSASSHTRWVWKEGRWREKVGVRRGGRKGGEKEGGRKGGEKKEGKERRREGEERRGGEERGEEGKRGERREGGKIQCDEMKGEKG